MGKKIVKGKKGEVKKYMSRAKALKILNIPLKDFRRICILKGIYPRQPKKLLDKSNIHKTYYHSKDINFLKCEKLIEKFQDIRTYNKKLEKYTARKDNYKINYLRNNKPTYSIDHLVKERYSNFNEAVNDLTDCLSTLVLLGSLPSHRQFKINPAKINQAKLWVDEFKQIVQTNKLVSKVFLSIKGIYYECIINDIKVQWLEPYNFTKKLNYDVDYKIILTFSEFYLSMFKFINYKLYSDSTLVYPPKIEEDRFILETDNNVNKKEDDKFKISEEFKNDKNLKKIFNKNDTVGIFDGLIFFISREVDKSIFEFLICSKGGKVCYDINNFESNTFKKGKITHVVTDRPVNGIKFVKNREYIQPQWICDSINNNILLNIEEYKPGSSLPPHLSPFVDSNLTGHKTEREKEIQKFKGEYKEESVHESDLEESEIEKLKESELDEIENNKTDKVDYKVEKNIKKKKITKKDNLKSKKEKEKLSKALLSNKKRRIVEKIEKKETDKKIKNKNLKRKK